MGQTDTRIGGWNKGVPHLRESADFNFRLLVQFETTKNNILEILERITLKFSRQFRASRALSPSRHSSTIRNGAYSTTAALASVNHILCATKWAPQWLHASRDNKAIA